MTEPYFRRMRSAESWIGVSGFLISWAMRRATSPHADVRWAETRSVTSSKVMTLPVILLALGYARGLRAPRRCDPRRRWIIVIWLCAFDFGPASRSAAASIANSGTTSGKVWPTRSSAFKTEELLGRGIGEPDFGRRASRPMTPAEMLDSTASMNTTALDKLRVGGHELAVLAAELLGHVIEILGQPPQVALAAIEGQLDRQVALGDLLGGADQTPDGCHDLAREPQTRPRSQPARPSSRS